MIAATVSGGIKIFSAKRISSAAILSLAFFNFALAQPEQTSELHAVTPSPGNIKSGTVHIEPDTGYSSWPGMIAGPSIYVSGHYFESGQITPPPNLPATGKITSVYFSWNTSYIPAAGLIVYLCDYKYCVNVSAGYSGNTTAFAGDSANTNFAFDFAVPGSGTAVNPPVYGKLDQVNVGYNY